LRKIAVDVDDVMTQSPADLRITVVPSVAGLENARAAVPVIAMEE
jgi:hypothetical protein